MLDLDHEQGGGLRLSSDLRGVAQQTRAQQARRCSHTWHTVGEHLLGLVDRDDGMSELDERMR
jgi:hypothetical protein